MRRRFEFRQLLIGMSISRYLPPMGTAGFDRRSVSGKSRVPRPPPRMIASTSSMGRSLSHGSGGVEKGLPGNCLAGRREPDRGALDGHALAILTVGHLTTIGAPLRPSPDFQTVLVPAV